MKLKKTSLILLLILFVILVFIVGVRYGQRVEKTNKIINYLISLPPTQTPQPTQKRLEFKEYRHTGCKIQFLYPTFLTKTEESSVSARFSGGAPSLNIDCSNQNKIREILENEKTATQEVKFKEKTVKGKLKPDLRTIVAADPYLIFLITHPKTAKNIYVEISKSLYPLFEKSLEFLP